MGIERGASFAYCCAAKAVLVRSLAYTVGTIDECSVAATVRRDAVVGTRGGMPLRGEVGGVTSKSAVSSVPGYQACDDGLTGFFAPREEIGRAMCGVNQIWNICEPNSETKTH